MLGSLMTHHLGVLGGAVLGGAASRTAAPEVDRVGVAQGAQCSADGPLGGVLDLQESPASHEVGPVTGFTAQIEHGPTMTSPDREEKRNILVNHV